jgi:hypothetical protein
MANNSKRKPQVFEVDEAQAAVLIYNEQSGTPLSQEEFDGQVQAMRQGIKEIDAADLEAKKHGKR